MEKIIVTAITALFTGLFMLAFRKFKEWLSKESDE
jgi:hypothetical protein